MRRLLGHKSGTLMNGISAHEDPERSLTHLPCEVPAKSPKWGSGASPDIKYTYTLTLDFTASRTMRNKFLPFISYSVYGISVTAG